MLEATLPWASFAEAVDRWPVLVRQLTRDLGWPDGLIVIRRHASGVGLALTAPEDQLFTATEVNEWAWLRALMEAGEADFPKPFGPGHPAVDDEAAALLTLRILSAAEARPRMMALRQAAAERGLPVIQDDEQFSLGAGSGHRAWPLSALPDPAEVPWPELHDIPTVLVTGSNGKTTSVRLLAAMLAAHGRAAGFTCTDGVFVDGETKVAGDYAGPAGARRILRDSSVEVAILETARGGILRRGLAVNRADVALVTNVSPDHFGEYGIHSLEDLADAKLVVARALGDKGLLVLNADDPVLAARASALASPIGWFSLDDEGPRITAHRAAGGSTCAVRQDRLLLHWKGEGHDLGAVEAMPLSAEGHATYNIANLAGAALAAAALGVAPAAIASVLAAFGASRTDNPGRLETWRFRGITVFMDYAHNPEGLDGLLKVATAHRGAGRLGLMLGQAGNREDAAIRDLAAVAARFEPDLIVLKDLQGYMRGRQPGEIPEILRAELLRCGYSEDRLRVVLPELEGARELLAWAAPDDVLVLPVHGRIARDRVARELDAEAAKS